jgi:hypothetical protein
MQDTGNMENKKEKKYGMVQLPAEVHKDLKEYADKHGFKISALLANIIKQYIKKK